MNKNIRRGPQLIDYMLIIFIIYVYLWLPDNVRIYNFIKLLLLVYTIFFILFI